MSIVWPTGFGPRQGRHCTGKTVADQTINSQYFSRGERTRVDLPSNDVVVYAHDPLDGDGLYGIILLSLECCLT